MLTTDPAALYKNTAPFIHELVSPDSYGDRLYHGFRSAPVRTILFAMKFGFLTVAAKALDEIAYGKASQPIWDISDGLELRRADYLAGWMLKREHRKTQIIPSPDICKQEFYNCASELYLPHLAAIIGREIERSRGIESLQALAL